MKKILIALLFSALVLSAHAQDFDKNLASARSAYSTGNLEDARFAMQQMMNDIDMIIGKELLKMMPAKMEALTSNSTNDNVTAETGIAGVLVHRDYGTGNQTANLDIMSHSPLIASVNAILAIPFIGNAGDGTQKVIKVQGYKGVLQKDVDSQTNKTNYTLQIPLNSTLLTFTVNDTNEAEITRMANTIPVAQIARLVQ